VALRTVEWQFLTDVTGKPVGPISRASDPRLAVEYGTSRLSRSSLVGIATDYALDGPGIEFRWGRDYSHTSRPALRSTQPPVTMGTGSFPGVKRPGRGADHPPPSSAEVKKE
jgi:hypothetical protein